MDYKKICYAKNMMFLYGFRMYEFLTIISLNVVFATTYVLKCDAIC